MIGEAFLAAAGVEVGLVGETAGAGVRQADEPGIHVLDESGLVGSDDGPLGVRHRLAVIDGEALIFGGSAGCGGDMRRDTVLSFTYN